MKTTKQLYLTDSYQKEATAKIINITSAGVKTSIFLDQTIFYPQGGGQPADHGTITNDKGTLTLSTVRYNNGLIEHVGTISGALEVGDSVNLTLDWDRRYQNMQIHTAGHMIDEAVKEITPEFHGVDGMHGIDNKRYIEFNGFVDESIQSQIMNRINDMQSANESITSEMVTKKEIEERHIFIPFKLPENKSLRLVQFGKCAPVPDGGTQLKTTGELWPTTLATFEYVNGHTRIHYNVDSPVKIKQPEVKKENHGEISLSQFKSELEASKNLPFKETAKLIVKLAPNDRKEGGKLLNELKNEIESKRSNDQTIKRSDVPFFDPTIPGLKPEIGHTHLITEAIEEIETIFNRLGFVRRRYPEIESDWYYAEGLNIPKDHPARDDQETFYFSENVVLTAHTSNGQLREMELMGKPPIKMINIGKTYRRQASNTHSPMFHQFEGLLIDKNITISHLVGVSNYFAKQYFGPDREIRLRPHHFQFTEPSFEVDINCHICKGTGKVNGTKCKVCKSGWLELGGAGMVHPNVLRNGGIDPDQYSGFAFGWGVERVIMMKHQVTDNLRELYTQDLRFLTQT